MIRKLTPEEIAEQAAVFAANPLHCPVLFFDLHHSAEMALVVIKELADSLEGGRLPKVLTTDKMLLLNDLAGNAALVCTIWQKALIDHTQQPT